MKMIMFASLLTSMLITLTTNPMTMVIMIIIQSLLICLMLFLCLSMTWYSYILFLIFMGGLMVLFIYICSIASNEMFLSSTNNKMMTLMPALAISMVLMSSSFKMNLLDMSKMNVIFKMMESMNIMLVLTAMFFLLFSLIVVVKIANMKMGPVRAVKK